MQSSIPRCDMSGSLALRSPSTLLPGNDDDVKSIASCSSIVANSGILSLFLPCQAIHNCDINGW